MNTPTGHNPSTAFVQHLVAFYRKLKGNGVKVTLKQEIDAYRSLAHIDLLDYTDFYNTLRANLIVNQKDVPPFNNVFFSHWARPESLMDKDSFFRCKDSFGESFDEKELLPDSLGKEMKAVVDTGLPEVSAENGLAEGSIHDRPDREVDDRTEEYEIPLYCPDDQIKKKDFSTFVDEDLEEIKQAISDITKKIRIRLSRRKKLNVRDQFFDFRRTIRKNVGHGGQVLHLSWKARKNEKNRLVVFCDVSGSMEIYSRFLIQFLYVLQKSLYNMETFVFSTRLNRVTSILRSREYESAMAHITRSVHDWSGGTKIGDCLQAFNRKYASKVLYGKTVAIIISDGWDCGEEKRLREEMVRLRKYAYHIIWLNPLMANPQYEPVCMGMRTVLPFLDQFLPLNNLESLVSLGHTLEKIG